MSYRQKIGSGVSVYDSRLTEMTPTKQFIPEKMPPQTNIVKLFESIWTFHQFNNIDSL